MADRLQANVEEVFIDLCRQMLRRDDEYNAQGDADDKYDNGHKRRRRRRKQGPRCVIL